MIYEIAKHFKPPFTVYPQVLKRDTEEYRGRKGGRGGGEERREGKGREKGGKASERKGGGKDTHTRGE